VPTGRLSRAVCRIIDDRHVGVLVQPHRPPRYYSGYRFDSGQSSTGMLVAGRQSWGHGTFSYWSGGNIAKVQLSSRLSMAATGSDSSPVPNEPGCAAQLPLIAV
jgi:hypothetical protein